MFLNKIQLDMPSIHISMFHTVYTCMYTKNDVFYLSNQHVDNHYKRVFDACYLVSILSNNHRTQPLM